MKALRVRVPVEKRVLVFTEEAVKPLVAVIDLVMLRDPEKELDPAPKKETFPVDAIVISSVPALFRMKRDSEATPEPEP